MKANCGLVTTTGARPHAYALLLGQLQNLLAGGERIGDRFFAPDVLAGGDRLAIEVLVLLHVGRIYQQVEICTGEHLRDVRVVVGDVVILGLVDGPLGDDVAGADKFRERTLR